MPKNGLLSQVCGSLIKGICVVPSRINIRYPNVGNSSLDCILQFDEETGAFGGVTVALMILFRELVLF